MCYGLLDFIFTIVHSTLQYFVQKKVWSSVQGPKQQSVYNIFHISDCVKLKKNLSWHQNEIPAKNYHQREIHFNMYPVRQHQANIIKISMQSLKLTGRQPKMTVQLAM